MAAFLGPPRPSHAQNPCAFAQVSCATRGDINCDGQINSVDLELLGDALFCSPCPTCPNQDVNRDGRISVPDLLVLGQYLGEGTPTPTFTNTATITFTGTATRTPTQTATVTRTFTPSATPTPPPSVEVDISINPNPVLLGENFDVAIHVTNNGSGILAPLTVESLLPAQINAFGANRTVGAPATCRGDGATGTCSPGETVVWTIASLAPGEGVTLTMPPSVITGGSAPVDGTELLFRGSVLYSGAQIGLATRNAVVDNARRFDLALDLDKQPVAPGELLNYRLSFGNSTTSVLAQGVTASLALPGGVTFVSASDGGVFDDIDNRVDWTIGNLTVGQNGTRQVIVRIDGAAPNAELVRAEASIEDSGGHLVTATAETRVQAVSPLGLTMELDPDPVQPGDVITGRLTVSNTGNAPQTGVSVELFLPAAVTAFSPSQTSGATLGCVGDGSASCSPLERVVWTVGTLQPGTHVLLTAPLPIGAGVPAGRVVTFNAQASDDLGHRVADRGSVRVDATRLLDLAIAEDFDPVALGSSLRYRLAFGNQTTASLSQNTTLRMPVPEGAVFVSASDGGTLNVATNTIEWTLGTLTVGQTGGREVVLDLLPELVNGDVLRAEALIQDSTGRRTRATTETRVQAEQPLHLTMEVNADPIQRGEVITGRLTVTNTGLVPLQGVDVELFIPFGIVTFNPNQTSGAPASCFGDGSAFCSVFERLVYEVGTIDPGAGVVLTLPLPAATDIELGHVYTFDVQAKEDNGSKVSTRALVSVVSSRLLDLTVDEDNDPALASELLTYRLSFGNATNSAQALGVTLTIPLPAGVSFVSASDGGTFNEATNSVEWTIGLVGLGQTGTRQVVVQPDSNLPDGSVLRAEATIQDTGGRRTRATAETRIQSPLPLHLTMELNPDPVLPGEVIIGRLLVSNSGPVPLLGVQVEMFLPAGLVTFNPNQTSGAPVACIGDGSAFCSINERLVWTVGMVPEGSGIVLTVPLPVAANVAPGHVFTFNAQSIENAGSKVTTRGSVRVVSSRLLDLSLDEDREPVGPPEQLTYRLSFGNATTSTLAQGVVLRMPLPLGGNFISASNGGVLNEEQNTVEWTLGNLALGQTGFRDLVVQVDDNAQNGAVIRAQASLEDSGGGRTRAMTDTLVETDVPLHLTIELNPDPVQPNETATARLTVSNTSPIPLLNVEVEMYLPDSLAVFNPSTSSGAPSCIGDGSGFCSPRERIVWTVASLAAGTGVTLSTPLSVVPGVTAGHIFTFNAQAKEASGYRTTARTSMQVQSSRLLDLSLDDDIDPIEPGQELTYHLSFGNGTASAMASGVVLQMPLPAGTTFVEASDGGMLDESSGVVEWAIGAVAMGQSGSRTMTVQVENFAVGSVLPAEAAIADGNGRTTVATTETRVETGSPLELSFTVSSDLVAPNGSVAGMLTVSNTSAIPLLGVQVELSLPLATNTFNPNTTSGAPAACIGDGSGVCSALERLVFTVGTVGANTSIALTSPLPIAANIPKGRVVTYNARALDSSGLTAAARLSLRVGP